MQVKELIELLTQVDPENEVSFLMDSGCCGDSETMEVNDSYVSNFGKGESWVTIRFSPLPGYRSCIQAGSTLRMDKEWCDKYRKGDTT